IALHRAADSVSLSRNSAERSHGAPPDPREPRSRSHRRPPHGPGHRRRHPGRHRPARSAPGRGLGKQRTHRVRHRGDGLPGDPVPTPRAEHLGRDLRGLLLDPGGDRLGELGRSARPERRAHLPRLGFLRLRRLTGTRTRTRTEGPATVKRSLATTAVLAALLGAPAAPALAQAPAPVADESTGSALSGSALLAPNNPIEELVEAVYVLVLFQLQQGFWGSSR